ncbi:hypothetical protein AeRB84_000132 [Aphanomyces euteiches]|nr:hypothetical protein AeRB84_000132 [Aphanomyces euteiches]
MMHDHAIVDTEDPERVLCQASSQIKLGGKAVAKTIEKLLGRDVSAKRKDRRTMQASQVPSYKLSPEYVKTCKQLYRPLESNGCMAINQLQSTFERQGLRINSAKLNAWLQRPRTHGDDYITFGEFLDACFTLYGPSLSSNVQIQDADASPSGTTAQALFRHVHPFDDMVERNKQALEFSYAHHGKQNPIEAQMRQDALTRSQSMVTMDTPYPSIRRVSSEQELREIDEKERSKKAIKVIQQRERAAAIRDKQNANIHTANNFSSSVGMVARHIQIGEINEKRQYRQQQQKLYIKHRKEIDKESRDEMDAFNSRLKLLKMHDMHKMKTQLHDQLAFELQKKEFREEMIRRRKDPFTISDSTCTLQRRPPELLAALAGVQTPSQQKRLARAERRYFDQSRSQQLRDYKHDKEFAKPSRYVPAPIVNVDRQDPDTAWHNQETELSDAMNALFDEWVRDQKDLSLLVPTSNSPPAALRYYGSIKQLPACPFMSSTQR